METMTNNRESLIHDYAKKYIIFNMVPLKFGCAKISPRTVFRNVACELIKEIA